MAKYSYCRNDWPHIRFATAVLKPLMYTIRAYLLFEMNQFLWDFISPMDRQSSSTRAISELANHPLTRSKEEKLLL